MPNRDDVWLSPSGHGGTSKWQGVEALLDKDVSDAEVTRGLEKDYFGPAQGAHFWNAAACPLRRPLAGVVEVSGDGWRKSEPAGWQGKVEQQFTTFYQQQVCDSVWAPGSVIHGERPLSIIRPPANQTAIVTGVVQCELSASMLDVRQGAAVIQAAQAELSSAFGHPPERVHVDAVSGPKLKLNVRVEASWQEAAGLTQKLQRACGGLKLTRTQEAFRKGTGLPDANATVISKNCAFTRPRQQISLTIGNGVPVPRVPCALAWIGMSGVQSLEDSIRKEVAKAQPPKKTGPKPAPKARVASAAPAISTEPVQAEKKAGTLERAKPKVALGQSVAPQSEAEKKALAAKRMAILQKKMRPTEEDPVAPPAQEAPKRLEDQVATVKKLLTINSYWRGAINFVGEVGGVVQRHLENYELMIDQWDDATKTLRGWHMHSSRMREVKRQCTIRCFRRDKQLLVQIKDDVMQCKARLAGTDKLEGEVTLPSFAGKFTLQRDELGYP